MRASSSWIKLQFVVRKHVMNTYQMHTLSLFLFYHILTTSRSPFAALFDFFFRPFRRCRPSLQLISSLFFWWSVTLMGHIQLYCIMHPFICTCVCIFLHIFLGCLHCICDRVVFHCHPFIAVYRRISISDHFCAWRPAACKLYLLCLYISCHVWPYRRPLRGWPHLQAVPERAWCVGAGGGGPGYIHTFTSCMDQQWRRQPIWGCEERRRMRGWTGTERGKKEMMGQRN